MSCLRFSKPSDNVDGINSNLSHKVNADMKKLLITLVVIIAVIAGAAWYMLSGADEFIRSQIEKQGTAYMGTKVSVSGVSLALREGRLTISELEVDNPQGYSDEDAFSLDDVIFDLGGAVKEPYRVQEIRIDAPEVLYEVDADGKGNLLVLKENLERHLPKGNDQAQGEKDGPLLIVDKVTVSNVKLMINFEKLPTGQFQLDKKAYEVTLPTFDAGPIGQPNGMPANKVGAAIVSEMLDNIIEKAKSEARNKLKDKAREKVDEEKKKLMDKANEKLKGILDKG